MSISWASSSLDSKNLVKQVLTLLLSCL